MRRKSLYDISVICLAVFMAFAPVNASAAVLLKRGSSGSDVKILQITLKDLGYFTYPRITGYFGSITEAAVKSFQKDNGILADGRVGKITNGILYTGTNSLSVTQAAPVIPLAAVDAGKVGSFDWFKTVRYIFPRQTNALVTDVDTGRSFTVKRTYGTNHADVEPLTRNDAKTIRDIWGGWTWTRRAVIVQINGYTIAGSMSAMPHAGSESQPAEKILNYRSGGYGRGYNLDAVKGNGVDGVMDLHFLNSRTHNTNTVKEAHQIMVEKASKYLTGLGY